MRKVKKTTTGERVKAIHLGKIYFQFNFFPFIYHYFLLWSKEVCLEKKVIRSAM